MSTKQLPDIRADAGVITAARFMVLWDTDRVEVFSNEGQPIGIATDRDLIRHIAEGGSCTTAVGEVVADHFATSNGHEAPEQPTSVPSTEASGLTAGQVMSSPAVACSADATLYEIAELLADREISGVPVVGDSHELLGVVSERDLARALGAPLLRLAMKHPLSKGPFLRAPRRAVSARDIMSAPPIVAGPKTDLHTIALMMVGADVNRIPIADGEFLVGVVTRGDILRALAGTLEASPAVHRPPIVIGR
jgi:CBS domain-containing protein